MRGQLAETKSRIVNVTSTFRAQAEEDLAKSRGDLAVLEETIKSAQDRVRRTELRSPVHGIVNKLNVTTVGAVVAPGGNVMDIVPLDDTLLVEGRIRPQDIAFIRPDQDAVVKISAYDSSVYGSLKGKVERISADTIAEEKGQAEKETFYRVMVRTDKNHLGTAANALPIIPGMVATVEILTGRSRCSIICSSRPACCATRRCGRGDQSSVILRWRAKRASKGDNPRTWLSPFEGRFAAPQGDGSTIIQI